MVLEGRAVDDGTEGSRGRARGNPQRLLDAGLAPALLAHGLVEPCLDPLLPVFVEVDIGDHAIAAFRHLETCCNKE